MTVHSLAAFPRPAADCSRQGRPGNKEPDKHVLGIHLFFLLSTPLLFLFHLLSPFSSPFSPLLSTFLSLLPCFHSVFSLSRLVSFLYLLSILYHFLPSTHAVSILPSLHFLFFFLFSPSSFFFFYLCLSIPSSPFFFFLSISNLTLGCLWWI